MKHAFAWGTRNKAQKFPSLCSTFSNNSGPESLIPRKAISCQPHKIIASIIGINLFRFKLICAARVESNFCAIFC